MVGLRKEEPVQALECGPQINILFSAPDFTVPCPDRANEMVTSENTIFNWGGVTIAGTSPEIVVKFGSPCHLG